MRASVSLVRPGRPVQVWTLTTDHAASSYGQPVLVRGSEILGPGDTDAVLVVGDPVTAGRAEAAGFRVVSGFDEAPRFGLEEDAP